MDWQPIETAPKDGTEIDLWGGGGDRVPDCQWRNGWFTRGYTGWESLAELDWKPTHLMPLPPPPQQ